MVQLISDKPLCANRLWLEVPEHGAFEHLTEFRAFCNALKPLGCKIGIEHVGAQISRLGELHDLGLDYIKIDISVIRDIDTNTGNQAFLRGLCLIAHSIGLIAVAEGVQTPAEITALPELGLDGMTGPGIKTV
jgi:EAL domain-containing protein (putative c-di-GMP-specific phosphodiesterase class I)